MGFKGGAVMLERCLWVGQEPLYQDYHDHEWGVPVYDEQQLFEMLILEGMQAGLSWLTVLKKRAHYRKVCDAFDPHKIASYDANKLERLCADPGLIRHRLKLQAMISNAQAYLKLETSFTEFLWQFVNGEPIVHHYVDVAEIPTSTPQSELMAHALKQRGFKFVGSTICYAFMQAVGMVNDHTRNCFRYQANDP